ncbi:MAG TPA: arginase family protein [Thermoanaerobaculia bacterium]
MITILHAPSPLGLKPQLEGRVSGVRRAPEALRAAELHSRLGAAFAGTVEPPPYVADRDAVTGLRNVAAIAQYSVELADATARLLDGDAFPLVLGGDCSILLGTALALRRRGRFGVVYVDAHPDYLTIDQTETGGVAGLPLALVTGLGPDALVNLEHRTPYVDAHDTVSVASRDDFQIRDLPGSTGKRVEHSPIRAYPLELIRERSPGAVARDVMERMAARGVDGVWIHFDVDALDSAIMPAVDSPEPDGLTRAEAVELLSTLVAHPLARGLQVTIYDPDRDADGSAAGVLVDVLTGALEPRRGG